MTERVQAPGSWRSRQCWADAHRSRLRPQSHSRVHLDLEVSISLTYSFTHYSQKNSQMKRFRHRDAISGVRLSYQIGRFPRGRDKSTSGIIEMRPFFVVNFPFVSEYGRRRPAAKPR